jgi:sRNA-binding regulator protein Hfq
MTTKTRTQATHPSPSNGSKAETAPQRPKRNPDSVQAAVLSALKDKRVSMRTLDGCEVTGTLRAVDRYCIALSPDSGGLELWFKQAIAVVRPAQGDDTDSGGDTCS